MHPLVLVYEDLHWIDTSTEEFLGALVDEVGKPTHRILYTSGLLSRLGFDPSNLLLDHLIFLPKIS